MSNVFGALHPSFATPAGVAQWQTQGTEDAIAEIPSRPRNLNCRRAARWAAGLDVLTLKRYSSGMGTAKRATVYFEPEIHRALRLKAAASEKSISDMVNDAVKLTLAEDAEDLEAFESRRREPSIDFEQFVKALKRRGKL